MKSHSRTHTEREAAQARDDIRRLQHHRFASLSAELAEIYDSRRLTEADIDHMSEITSEGRTYNRSLPSTHE